MNSLAFDPAGLTRNRNRVSSRQNGLVQEQRLRRRVRAFLVLLPLFAFPSRPHSTFAQAPASQPAPDRGIFEILSAKNKVGTERFEIKTIESGWEASGELQLQGPGGAKVSETSTLRLDAKLHPSRYERVQKSPNSGKLSAQFGATETLLEMTDDDEPFQQVFYLPPNDLVVLDTNFFHHFALLLRLYDRAKGMAQAFNVFIPQEALPGTINLLFVAKESITVGQSARELDHFQAVTDELQIEIWATPEGAIQRISIPQADLEVVRQ